MKKVSTKSVKVTKAAPVLLKGPPQGALVRLASTLRFAATVIEGHELIASELGTVATYLCEAVEALHQYDKRDLADDVSLCCSRIEGPIDELDEFTTGTARVLRRTADALDPVAKAA